MDMRGLVLVCVVAMVCAAAEGATVQTVKIGNPYNTADTRYVASGLGRVEYTYSIGQYEVTAAQYTEFLNAVGGVDSYGLYHTGMWTGYSGCKIERYAGNGTAGNPYMYRVAADRANRPVQSVSWLDAVRFANWMHNGRLTGAQDSGTTEDGAYNLVGTHGKDGYELTVAVGGVTREDDAKWALPSHDEWYKAALYNWVTDSYYDYATSSNSRPGNRPVTNPDPGNFATFIFNGSGSIGDPYYFTEVGEHENSPSPYGTYDQNGNAVEYFEDAVDQWGHSRGARGGGAGSQVWPSSGTDYLHASYYGGLNDPYTNWGDYGFRLVLIPEPGTLALLGLGGASLLIRRRRLALR